MEIYGGVDSLCPEWIFELGFEKDSTCSHHNSSNRTFADTHSGAGYMVLMVRRLYLVRSGILETTHYHIPHGRYQSENEG